MKWKKHFEESTLRGAQDYVNDGRVTITHQDENGISGIVDGLHSYQCSISFQDGKLTDSSCGCLVHKSEYYCRHIAALLLKADIEDEEELPALPNEDKNISQDDNKAAIDRQTGNIILEKKSDDILLKAELSPVISYALLYNGLPVVESLRITNRKQKPRQDLTLTISDSEGYLEPFTIQVDELPGNDYRILSEPRIHGSLSRIIAMTDNNRSALIITLKEKEEVLVEMKTEVIVLPYDQWPGFLHHPVLLASFVQPQHPVIPGLLHDTADLLESWNESRSIEGYQSNDINRVRTLAAAAYGAIQKKNITYASPPASYNTVGQRIRLVDTIMNERMGNCMDMTLLYCSLLEAMRLNPFFVLVKGHIFAGVWLKEASFEQTIMTDPTQLDKRMAKGMNDLLVVECTAMNADQNPMSFEQACESARLSVINYPEFSFALDVLRARDLGIRSLPVRTSENGVYKVEVQELDESQLTKSPTTSLESYEVPDDFEERRPTKLLQWETKLLDLSGRNILLNLPLHGSIVTLLTSDISALEDALSDGEEFSLLPVMKEIRIPEDIPVVETVCSLNQFQKLLTTELKHHRLHSCLSQAELNRKMNSIFRSARTSMEENGVSTLYLSLGQLRWPDDRRLHYAPIVLVPVDLVRKGAKNGYAIRMRDEEAQINITLLEFLKQKYNIRIKGLLPPPEDEHGLDIPLIFTIIRRAIVNMEGWEVFETACLGNFQFSQFIMWNDVHTNPQFLQNNKIVNSLINGQIQWNSTLPQPVNPGDLQLPVLADSSQVQAIHAADVGSSFVLHGPPGTGKSQTITALIGNALGHGKTVLFVAEKKAALEVVQNRLNRLGIADFCLELHSNKATKKAVLDHLARGLEQLQIPELPDFEQKLNTCRQLREKLDDYARELHQKANCGMSLYELIAHYENLQSDLPVVYFDKAWAGGLSEADLSCHRQALRQLAAAGSDCPSLKDPDNNPLQVVHQTVYTQGIRFELPQILDALRISITALQDAASSFSQSSLLPYQSVEQLNILTRNTQEIADLQALPDFLAEVSSVEAAFEKPLQVMEKRTSLKKMEEELLHTWDPSFLIRDMAACQAGYTAAGKKLFGKAKAFARLVDELQGFARAPLSPEMLPVQFSRVELYQKEKKELDALERELSDDWRVTLNRTKTPEKLRALRTEWTEASRTMRQLPESLKKAIQSQSLSSLQAQAKDFLEKKENFEKNINALQTLLDCEAPSDQTDWRTFWLSLMESIRDSASSLKEWIVYQKVREHCLNLGLKVCVEAYEKDLDVNRLLMQYERSVLQAIILDLIEKSTVLNGFTGSSFNETIAQFAKLDNQLQELAREELQIRLQQARPVDTRSVEISRQMNILRRAIRSNGRGMTIRSLFGQIPDVLKKLCPCLLMSPMSVSQYLQPQNDLVDLVIFDEASQVPTCKAIGAIARAKNAIIAGDPNQMPPTSFFAGRIIDEENLDLEDLDSILDDCLALGLPSIHLRWHYRSRHESLISFSNQHFYENAMETFPSANDLEKKVSLKTVKGYFDRGKTRTNGAEAEAIVNEIKRRYENPEMRNQTLGVITFNIQQQILVEDLLLEEFKKDRNLEKWAEEAEEPLFIKNLENVQGDERDVILFSVAFGPDLEGKMLMNFGPLTRDGGWKRLNVAITRAREEMIVFTIMDPDDIDLRRTKSTGVGALKDFLIYARTTSSDSGQTRSSDLPGTQGILRQICSVVEGRGLNCDTHVGRSNIQVDAAVINPYEPEDYLLGILLDGSQYHNTMGTRDREVSQISVLESLGWDIERFWTMDWWDNSEKEKMRLNRLLDEALEKAKAEYERKKQKQQEQDNAAQTESQTDQQKSPDNSGSSLAVTSPSSADPADCRDSQNHLSALAEPAKSDDLENRQAIQSGTKQEIPEKQRMKRIADNNMLKDLPPLPIRNNQKSVIEADPSGKTGYESAFTENQESTENDVPMSSTEPIIPGCPAITAIREAGGATSINSFNNGPNRTSATETTVHSARPEKEKTEPSHTETGTSASVSSDMREIQTGYRTAVYTAAEKITAVPAKELLNPKSIPLITEKLQLIIDMEGPVELNALYKKALRLLGISRSSDALQEVLEKALKKAMYTRKSTKDGTFCWPKSVDPNQYMLFRTPASDKSRRSAECIAPQELKNAAVIILQEAGPMKPEDLVKAMGKLMGFSRISSAMNEALMKALQYASRQHCITKQNGLYTAAGEEKR